MGTRMHIVGHHHTSTCPMVDQAVEQFEVPKVLYTNIYIYMKMNQYIYICVYIYISPRV